MLFNSVEFLFFLPAVFFLYWFVFKRNLWWQNFFVVTVSYIFYGWWDWSFLLLIALTTFCSWLSGVWMGERDRETCPITGLRGHRKFVMVSNIILNLLILGCFKYFNFFQAEAIAVLQALGFQAHEWTIKILLPVGISFYTFQALSYSIDVYRGDIKPTQDMVAFFAYVSYFPQLVAGPIERATNLLPQFLAPRSFSYAQAVDGCRQMLWGFFKKMVVADNCSELANLILDGKIQNPCSGGVLWLGMFCFAIQIYGDFSGYSDIAIGCSRLFGIKIMRNFAYPYFSRDIAEFWRRWHISLSTWFRDYLYIPMGGSQVSTWKQIRNTFAIFLVSGFWHGANWTFVAWGAFHAIYFLPLLVKGQNRKHTNIVASGRYLPSGQECAQLAVTFILVLLAWVFFRATSITTAINWILTMLCLNGDFILRGDGLVMFRKLVGLSLAAKLTMGIFFLFAMEWANRSQQHALARCPKNTIIRYSLYLSLSVVILLSRGGQQTFIYFQF
jgi:D-alanyl-lipoteichoic acid acyltransferase DltB (MBOAT superfamily)